MKIDELKFQLKKLFGFNSFKGLQETVIRNLLNRENSFVVMPTGGGKSLCYQLAAVLGSGTTVVISPLKSLIHDQIKSLKENNISCIVISGETNKKELGLRRDEIEKGEYKLIYTTPETIGKNVIMSCILTELYNNKKLD
mgnify:CR=1 FL=1